ncbi:MAG: hypothetical protein WC372_12415 [Candidatus Neomarinimicrobiota bacterium]|jgi:hypothetical protein
MHNCLVEALERLAKEPLPPGTKKLVEVMTQYTREAFKRYQEEGGIAERARKRLEEEGLLQHPEDDHDQR